MATAQKSKTTAQQRKHWDRKWIPYVLLAPAIITILVIIVSPLLTTIYYSFSNIDLIRDRTTFIGLDNYIELFSSRLFWKAVEINLKFAAIVVTVPSLMGLIFALLLVEDFIGRGIGRTLLILPWALPWIVVGLLWNWLVNAQFGALNGLLYSLGLIDKYIPFMANEHLALVFTALASAWRQTSFSAILLLAALQTIPEDLYDASKVDGAGLWDRFRYITFTWLRPTLTIVVLYNIVLGFLQFDAVWIMTQGGPGDATMLISILLYRYSFINFDLGMGAAVSNVLGLITMGLWLDVCSLDLSFPGDLRIGMHMSNMSRIPWHGIIRKVVTYFAFICLLFWVGFPVYYMLITSFMDAPELAAIPPNWIPQEPTLENYREVIIGETGQRGSYGSTTEFSRMMPALLNSTFVSFAVVVSNLSDRLDGCLRFFPVLAFASRASPISEF